MAAHSLTKGGDPFASGRTRALTQKPMIGNLPECWAYTARPHTKAAAPNEDTPMWIIPIQPATVAISDDAFDP
jgi:hypothetical protein